MPNLSHPNPLASPFAESKAARIPRRFGMPRWRITMNLRIPVLAICVGLSVFGCGKADNSVMSNVPAQTAAGPAIAPSPEVPAPTMPPPTVTKGGETPSPSPSPTPTPGQANDHSSPAFKAGGNSDTHK
jgi:hypothetical protein